MTSVPRGRGELRALVELRDLPGAGWRLADERTWRTGILGDDQPRWQAAAHAAGSVTACRNFVAPERTLSVQVIPLADAADGPEALATPLLRGVHPADEQARELAGDRLVVVAGLGVSPEQLRGVAAAQVDRLSRLLNSGTPNSGTPNSGTPNSGTPNSGTQG